MDKKQFVNKVCAPRRHLIRKYRIRKKKENAIEKGDVLYGEKIPEKKAVPRGGGEGNVLAKIGSGGSSRGEVKKLD